MATIDSKNITMEYDYVTKRDGSSEEVSFDKILKRSISGVNMYKNNI